MALTVNAVRTLVTTLLEKVTTQKDTVSTVNDLKEAFLENNLIPSLPLDNNQRSVLTFGFRRALYDAFMDENSDGEKPSPQLTLITSLSFELGQQEILLVDAPLFLFDDLFHMTSTTTWQEWVWPLFYSFKENIKALCPGHKSAHCTLLKVINYIRGRLKTDSSERLFFLGKTRLLLEHVFPRSLDPRALWPAMFLNKTSKIASETIGIVSEEVWKEKYNTDNTDEKGNSDNTDADNSDEKGNSDKSSEKGNTETTNEAATVSGVTGESSASSVASSSTPKPSLYSAYVSVWKLTEFLQNPFQRLNGNDIETAFKTFFSSSYAVLRLFAKRIQVENEELETYKTSPTLSFNPQNVSYIAPGLLPDSALFPLQVQNPEFRASVLTQLLIGCETLLYTLSKDKNMDVRKVTSNNSNNNSRTKPDPKKAAVNTPSDPDPLTLRYAKGKWVETRASVVKQLKRPRHVRMNRLDTENVKKMNTLLKDIRKIERIAYSLLYLQQPNVPGLLSGEIEMVGTDGMSSTSDASMNVSAYTSLMAITETLSREATWRDWKERKYLPLSEKMDKLTKSMETAVATSEQKAEEKGEPTTTNSAPTNKVRFKGLSSAQKSQHRRLAMASKVSDDTRALWTTRLSKEDSQSKNNFTEYVKPSSKEFFEYFEQCEDPESGIEDEYHPKHDPVYCWRALRLFQENNLQLFKKDFNVEKMNVESGAAGAAGDVDAGNGDVDAGNGDAAPIFDPKNLLLHFTGLTTLHEPQTKRQRTTE